MFSTTIIYVVIIGRTYTSGLLNTLQFSEKTCDVLIAICDVRNHIQRYIIYFFQGEEKILTTRKVNNEKKPHKTYGHRNQVLISILGCIPKNSGRICGDKGFHQGMLHKFRNSSARTFHFYILYIIQHRWLSIRINCFISVSLVRNRRVTVSLMILYIARTCICTIWACFHLR